MAWGQADYYIALCEQTAENQMCVSILDLCITQMTEKSLTAFNQITLRIHWFYAFYHFMIYALNIVILHRIITFLCLKYCSLFWEFLNFTKITFRNFYPKYVVVVYFYLKPCFHGKNNSKNTSKTNTIKSKMLYLINYMMWQLTDLINCKWIGVKWEKHQIDITKESFRNILFYFYHFTFLGELSL